MGRLSGDRAVQLQRSGGVHVMHCLYVYTGLMVNNQAGRAEGRQEKSDAIPFATDVNGSTVTI